MSNVGRGKLMNPRSTAPYTDMNGTYNGWSDYIGQSCARQQTADTAGCFLDLLGPAGIRPEYNVGGAVPVDPQTHALFTPLDYESMTGSVADAARAALPAGATVTGNGYVNGHAYYLKASSTLNSYTDAAEAQAWLNRPANLDYREPVGARSADGDRQRRRRIGHPARGQAARARTRRRSTPAGRSTWRPT